MTRIYDAFYAAFGSALKSPFVFSENRWSGRLRWWATARQRAWLQTLALMLVLCVTGADCAFGAFGLSTNTDNYAVDTGAGLVFKIRRTDNGSSTQSPGDIMSLVYQGVEYQDQSRGSQINSGFDWLGYSNSTVNVSAEVVNTNYIKITVTTANLIHYYIARKGDPCIYMATYFDVEPVTGGPLCRYIVRMPHNLLPNGPPPSDLSDTTYTVESGDIFGTPDGETRSKHYSNHRLLDWFYTGATGNGVGVFMLRDSQEGGSGGPFYRCLINQGGGDQELYDIINYGEAQTEPYRIGILNGPYTIMFTDGTPPVAPLDYSWMDTAGLNLTHYVPASGRGVVQGTATGVPGGFQTVVGFANPNAQYWAIATNGTYTTPRMIPGTYTATLYQQELAVATASVTVTAGATNTLNLVSAEANPNFIFKLGDWDGTPAGFLNADKMSYMHPTDVRMSSWTNTDFTVENNPAPEFPAIQARQVNGTLTLHFHLTAAQAAAGHTVRIGMTTAYNNGRPNITVNNWTSALSAAPNEPGTRTFTIGSYRGNNLTYTFNVPASAFVAGDNVLNIGVISGSGDLGGWLSAGWVYDCVQLDGTPIAPLPPANVAATMNASQVNLSWTPVFNAVSYRIKRATQPGGPYTTIATNFTASFHDTSAVAATRYYYVVSSVNSAGESSNSEAVAAGIGPALVAYLPFNENSGTNATDATGHGWNGTLQAGAGWGTGRYGSAVSLDGTSNYATLPEGVVSDLSDFTIAAWVNQNSVSTWSRVFDFGNGTNSYMFLTPRAANSAGTIRFAITVASGGGEQQIDGISTLPTGWHHVAVTHRGSQGILYVDGVAVGTNNAMTLTPSDLNPTTQNYLGKSQWPLDPYLNGRVDDFRIYNSALSAAQIAALVASPPFGPAKIYGTAISANQINLNWSPTTGATDYNVRRSLTSGGPYTTVATGLTTTSFSDTGLNGDTPYYYLVSAVDAIGNQIDSPELRIVTPTAPDAPAGLTAMPVASGQNNLAWTASLQATNYLVKRATVSGGPYAIIATNAATSFADTSIIGGVTYYYVVAALGATGESTNSPEASARALPTLEAYLKFDEASGTIAADSTGNGWNGTLVNSPGWVAGYSNNAVSLNSGSSQYVTLPAGVVSRLTDFTIAAWVKPTTISTWSRLFDFGTGTSANMFLTPQNGNNNVVRFAITTGGGAGEQQIDGTAALPAGIWSHVTVTLSGTTGILYVNGLPVGTNRNLTLNPSSLGITTQNYLGKSQYSDPYFNGLEDDFRIYHGALSASDVATFITPLPAPAINTATVGDGQAMLSWNAVAGANGYQILRSLTAGGPYATLATLAGTSFTDTGLLNGTNYFYVVKAVNAVEGSAPSAEVSLRPVSSTPPPLALLHSGNQLQLAWPATHLGWQLEMQTNSLTQGLGTNWVTVPNSEATNQWTVPVNAANGSAFFRLVSPY